MGLAKGSWASVSSAAHQPFKLIVLCTDCPDESGERLGPGAGGKGVSSSFGEDVGRGCQDCVQPRQCDRWPRQTAVSTLILFA